MRQRCFNQDVYIPTKTAGNNEEGRTRQKKDTSLPAGVLEFSSEKMTGRSDDSLLICQ